MDNAYDNEQERKQNRLPFVSYNVIATASNTASITTGMSSLVSVRAKLIHG